MTRTTTSARRHNPRSERAVVRKRARQDAHGGMDWAKFDALTNEEVIARAMTGPDANRAYLKVIAVNPDLVKQALAQPPAWKR